MADKIIAPFDLNKSLANIPATNITIKDYAKGSVNGYYKVDKQVANLNITLNKIIYKDLVFNKSDAKIKLLYDTNSLNISTKNIVQLKYKNKDIKIDKTSLIFQDDTLYLDNKF